MADLADMERVWKQRLIREDYRAAVIATLISNMFRGNSDPAANPGDFFPSLEFLRPPPLTVEEEEARLDALFAAFK